MVRQITHKTGLNHYLLNQMYNKGKREIHIIVVDDCKLYTGIAISYVYNLPNIFQVI